tara:strand:+ start:3788 stop:4342 length:555 start_codon:yes stop_codon:yes gene_type:complete
MADKIEEIKKKITAQEKMLAKFKSAGRNETVVKKLEANVKDLKEKLKAMETPAKPKVKKAVSGSLTKEQCDAMLEVLRVKYKKSEANTKKNIKSGKAVADGSLKPSASLENEAETIENKSEAGQKITKKEQKVIAFNIEKIVENCVQMIPYKKDADSLLRDLIRILQELREDIDTGRLRPGSQN